MGNETALTGWLLLVPVGWSSETENWFCCVDTVSGRGNTILRNILSSGRSCSILLWRLWFWSVHSVRLSHFSGGKLFPNWYGHLTISISPVALHKECESLICEFKFDMRRLVEQLLSTWLLCGPVKSYVNLLKIWTFADNINIWYYLFSIKTSINTFIITRMDNLASLTCR